jgi:hypothetical protein
VIEDESIDPVSNSETIARLTSPDEWADGFLLPEALLRDDLMHRDRGWSVQRVECTSFETATGVCRGLNKDPATAEAVCVPVLQIRELLDDERGRCAFVVANPLLGNDGHALTFAHKEMKRGEVKRLKDRLILLLTKKSPIAKVFQIAA